MTDCIGCGYPDKYCQCPKQDDLDKKIREILSLEAHGIPNNTIKAIKELIESECEDYENKADHHRKWNKKRNLYVMKLEKEIASLKQALKDRTEERDKNFQAIVDLENDKAGLKKALEAIIEYHGGYCENHLNISRHSDNLVNMVQQALKGEDDQKIQKED